MNTDNTVSLGRLFEELQSTQASIQDLRTKNRSIHQQLRSLTKNVSNFSSPALSKNENDLDRHRDANVKEDYKLEIESLLLM
ncbi:unnamed protein product [Rotaria sordida]|uniref:Uncharacterized protein n=1 Tax=Rotaria sordida TaxID=392033 RepID=A0A815MIL2_9BILA|nr:unnamed protein product [Rotaria sordida]